MMAEVNPPVAQKIERLRSLAAQHQVPIDLVDRIAVSPARAARAIDVCKRKLEGWIANGDLPIVQLDRSVRILVVDLFEFLEEKRTVRMPRNGKTIEEQAAQFLDGLS